MLTNWLMHFNGVVSSVRSKNIVWAIISRFSVWSFGECLVESDGAIAAVLGEMIFRSWSYYGSMNELRREIDRWRSKNRVGSLTG